MTRYAICFLLILTGYYSQAQLIYPPTQKADQVDDYHGMKVPDPYRWLEDDRSEATSNWVIGQNKVTSAYLNAIPFRNKLRKRMGEVYNYPRYSEPFRRGQYLYFSKNDGLQNQSILYRQKGLSGEPEVVIDPNTLSKDGTTRLSNFVPSKNGQIAAFGLSRAGSDWQTFYVKDMATMKNATDSVQWVKVSGIAWYKKGFFYSRYPQPEPGMELASKNENHQVWYHEVGTAQSQDKLIFQDTSNLQRFHFLSTDEDERYAFLSVSDRGKGLRGNALYFRALESGDDSFKPVVGEVGQYNYSVIGITTDNKFLVFTNDSAPNSKIMLVDPASPQKSEWKPVVREKEEPLEDADFSGGRLFLCYLKDVTSKITVCDETGRQTGEVALPGPGTASGFDGLKSDTSVFYSYSSYNFPARIYRYDIASGRSTLFRSSEVSFVPHDYITKQEFYSGKDGTKIPLFVLHKKGIKMDGKNPTLLYAYGGFNISLKPGFSTSIIPFLEQGGIYAVANLRGGSEYGESWHEAGMLEKKQTVFDDFIAAAEYLITNKYTSKEKLAIRGGSNGGLLVGAVINQRPDLFRVAIPEVGVMDMLRFHKFTIGWNWIAEYGSSDREKDFKYLYAYSPLHNIKTGINYPAVLVTTADHDDRVVPAHSFKYIAALQEAYKGKNPVLIRIETNSGHGASSITKNIELASDIFSFILYNLGVQWKDVK